MDARAGATSGRAAAQLDWPKGSRNLILRDQIRKLKHVDVPDRVVADVVTSPHRLQQLVMQELQHLDKSMQARHRTLHWNRPETESVTRTVGDTNSQRNDGSAQVDISYKVTPGPMSVARVETISSWHSLGGTNKPSSSLNSTSPYRRPKTPGSGHKENHRSGRGR